MTRLGPTMFDGIGAVFVLAALAFLIWALVDIWKSRAEQNTKLLWTLLVVLVNPIGAILWFTVGKKSNK